MSLNVTIPHGTTHDIKVTITAKDLTGATAICTFVTTHGVAPTLTKRSSDGGITITGAVNSTVKVHLLPTDGATLTLVTSPYYYQIRVTLSGVQELVEDGVLTLTANDTYGVV